MKPVPEDSYINILVHIILVFFFFIALYKLPVKHEAQ